MAPMSFARLAVLNERQKKFGRKGHAMIGEIRQTNDEVEIRALLEARAQSVHDRDADSALANSADDILVFDLPPPLQLGAEQALDKGNLVEWFDTWQGPIDWEMRDLRIAADGEVAFAHALYMDGSGKAALDLKP